MENGLVFMCVVDCVKCFGLYHAIHVVQHTVLYLNHIVLLCSSWPACWYTSDCLYEAQVSAIWSAAHCSSNLLH